MKQRLIHFERIDPERGEVGFYCGYHNLTDFSEDECREFDNLQDNLFGPHMIHFRDFKFFFTRYGFKKYKKLICYLIRATDCKTICWRAWKEDHEVAYEDKEQVALYMNKRRIRKRNRNIEKASNLLFGKSFFKSYPGRDLFNRGEVDK